MAELSPVSSRVRFGTFEVDLEARELRRNGIRLKLQDQPFQLLAMFLERPGEVVTREAVRERLWPADTFVDFDHSLNTAIKKLRHALGDSAENPRFIETLARRGYRFIAPVGLVAAPSAGPVLDAVRDAPLVERAGPPLSPPDAPPPRPGRGRILALSLASVLILILIAWGTRRWVVVRSSPADGRAAGAVQLAVLPLKVLTPGDTERHLGVGIADAVITQLANVRTLSVRPTAAVIRYEAGAPDPRLAGQELDAEHVLSGTLQKSGETFRISMQLIRTADGVPIWGHSYHVARTDLLTIEDQVSRQVAEALRAQLKTVGQARQRTAPKNPAAYESYLQGRALLVNYSEAKMRAAIESFERALQLEPDYALARAGLANSLAWFSVRYAYQKDALYWGRRAEDEASRALALDHDLADAHLAIAHAAGTIYGRFNWARLLAEADEALRLDPSLDPAHAARARALYHLGLFDRARRRRQGRSRSIPHRTSKPSGCWWPCRCSAAASRTPGNGQRNWPRARTPRSSACTWARRSSISGARGGRGAARQHQTWHRARCPVARRAGRGACRHGAAGRRAGDRQHRPAKHLDGSPRRLQPRRRVRATPPSGGSGHMAAIGRRRRVPVLPLVRGGSSARADPPGPGIQTADAGAAGPVRGGAVALRHAESMTQRT